MTISACRFAFLAFSTISVAACASAPEPSTRGESTSSTASAVSGPVWELEEYTNFCADACGAPTCSCITNRCSASLEGQPCSPDGAICNVVYNNYYKEMFCETPPPPPPTWTRIATESCLDVCGTTNCNCVTHRCVGNPEGQACSPVGASCNVVSGRFFNELTCQ
jgi:hypothetical protein